jgi:hypothetical protein
LLSSILYRHLIPLPTYNSPLTLGLSPEDPRPEEARSLISPGKLVPLIFQSASAGLLLPFLLSFTGVTSLTLSSLTTPLSLDGEGGSEEVAHDSGEGSGSGMEDGGPVPVAFSQ